MRTRVLLAAGLVLAAPLAAPQTPPPAPLPAPVEARADDRLSTIWRARWISVAGAPAGEFGVYHFRRAFELPEPPRRFIVHVTADNRYQLYVNGERVAWGPARGDLTRWRYETLDLAPWLRQGRNVVAAVVWNFGPLAPLAQISAETGFLLQGEGEAEGVVDTGPGWTGIRNEAYAGIPVSAEEVRGYYAAGPGERLEAARYPWGWERPDFDDRAWPGVRVGPPGAGRYAQDSPSRWMLVPREIPMMEERPERLRAVRRAVLESSAEGGVARQAPLPVPEDFPQQPGAIAVPPRSTARLLLDQGQLTTAFPELVVRGGRAARITLRYAEALFEQPKGTQKGHRDRIEGKHFAGFGDVLVADGAHRTFRPLWWRAYRYLELVVETRDDPLTIEDVRSVYTGYPFVRRARFDAESDELDRILAVGWHTARLCAHETYMDCPYYEQLQYAGDTRIQALVSLYMSGDARLMRTAIELLDSSRTAEGLTFSRAPSRLQQYIPPFSLWWIGMLHDFWRYQDDPAFVRVHLPGVRAVLSFFSERRKPNGSLGRLPWWNFVDWTGSWRAGVPPAEPDGSSAPIDLQLLLAYGWAAELEEALGSRALAAEYRQAEAELRRTVAALYWDAGRGLFADTPARASFSQHTNALAVLARVVEGDAARQVVERLLADRSLTKASIYFQFYVHEAVRLAGLGDRYLGLLDDWRGMLALGLTTWAETADPTRSDCHAWGSSPNIQLFRTVLGIDSLAPGFRRVLVRPFPGSLARVTGAIPHPRGEVAVSLDRRGGRLIAEIALPDGVDGELEWAGRRRPLPSGRSRVELEP
ncbi:MAG TPA: alpha-L-rhamnosidase C-terminal domain-containing protein [Vicinamibacterales bacterium]|nr:alpha-L-rhamnosidase C-terminal domain-containing protein [Vicinamibacterales bacterium]